MTKLWVIAEKFTIIWENLEVRNFFFGYGKKIFGGLLFAQNVEICSNKTKNSWFLQELQFSFLVNSNS